MKLVNDIEVAKELAKSGVFHWKRGVVLQIINSKYIIRKRRKDKKLIIAEVKRGLKRIYPVLHYESDIDIKLLLSNMCSVLRKNIKKHCSLYLIDVDVAYEINDNSVTFKLVKKGVTTTTLYDLWAIMHYIKREMRMLDGNLEDEMRILEEIQDKISELIDSIEKHKEELSEKVKKIELKW